jgi:hypothetical protein
MRMEGLTGFAELLDERGPFGAEHVGTGERAVTSANHKRVDALLDHVVCGSEPAFLRPEGF